MADRSLLSTLRSLALAMLNATLILVALCLFLAWQVVDGFRDVTGQVSGALQGLSPLREDVRSLADESAALRAELASLRAERGETRAVVSTQTAARLAELEDDLARTGARIEKLVAHPETLLLETIGTGAETAAQALGTVFGCARPG